VSNYHATRDTSPLALVFQREEYLNHEAHNTKRTSSRLEDAAAERYDSEVVGRRGLQITQALDMKNMQGGQTYLRAQVYLIFPMKALGSSSSTTSATQPLGYKTGRRQLNGVQIAQRTTNQLYDVLELPL